jgi:hypothetical protein
VHSTKVNGCREITAAEKIAAIRGVLAILVHSAEFVNSSTGAVGLGMRVAVFDRHPAMMYMEGSSVAPAGRVISRRCELTTDQATPCRSHRSTRRGGAR